MFVSFSFSDVLQLKHENYGGENSNAYANIVAVSHI
jgi:hypothetical protein